MERTKFHSFCGRAVAQAVNRRLPTAAARVQATVMPSVTMAGFLLVLRFPLRHSIRRLVHSDHRLSFRADRIGQ
jgi:hypothetical protein